MGSFLFRNGQVITMEKEGLVYPACAVRENRIFGVGEPEFLKTFLGKDFQEVDMKGGVLVPGFVDCHLHFILACYFKMNLDLMGMGVASIDELLSLLKKKVSLSAPGKWIMGLRMNENDYKEKRFPLLQELDQVAPDNPVLILRYDGHSCIANTRALDAAGLDLDTPDPPGGEIVKADGGLTGVLKEKAMVHVLNAFPIPGTEEFLDGQKKTTQALLSEGVVGFHNILMTGEDGVSGALGTYEIPLFKLFEPDLPFRHYPMVSVNSVSEALQLLETEFHCQKQGGIWRGGALKLFADGTFGSRTALLFEDYADLPGERGFMVCEAETLREIIFEAQEEGLRVVVHAIGDKAVHQVARMFLDAALQIGHKHLRHRIEHCGAVQPETVDVLKNANVICSMQPSFIVSEGTWIRDRMGDRVARVYPMRTLLDAAIRVCGGSDTPVEVCRPLSGMWGAVVREGFTPDQAITPYEALSLYTSRAAYASCQEHLQGTITPGKMADLVALDNNPLSVPPEEIRHIRVTLTMIDGKIRWQRE